MADARHNSVAVRRPCSPDQLIGSLSGRQHGIVTREQLRSVGFTDSAIDRRLRAGRLIKLHPAVFAVGDRALPVHGAAMAAVLWAGEGATLSHRSAASMLGLRRWDGDPEITVPRRTRRRPRVIVHRAGLQADEVVARAQIPTTSLARTILDLAPGENLASLRHLVDEGRRLDRRVIGHLARLCARYERRAGTPRVRRILGEIEHRAGITRSYFEAEFLSFLETLDMPEPAVNEKLRVGHEIVEVDFLWSDARLVVELDGHAFHSDRAAQERDKRRDRRLLASGYRVVRVTWRQFQVQREELASDLVAAYRTRGT